MSTDTFLKGFAETCGVARFLTLLDGPWATLIVRELLASPLRFGQLLTALDGISAHTLTSRLRKFEANGLLIRTSYSEIRPRVAYELTPLGRELRPVVASRRGVGSSETRRRAFIRRLGVPLSESRRRFSTVGGMFAQTKKSMN